MRIIDDMRTWPWTSRAKRISENINMLLDGLVFLAFIAVMWALFVVVMV
jgi:hypothetical protein